MEKVYLACRVVFGFKFGEVEIAVHFFPLSGPFVISPLNFRAVVNVE